MRLLVFFLLFLSSFLTLVLPLPSHLAVLFFTADGAQTILEVSAHDDVHNHNDVQNAATHLIL